MHIRLEQPGEEPALHALTYAAFKPMSFSDNSEADRLEILRRDGDLTLSLVAVDDDGDVIGHAAFSPATIGAETEGWYGLGPISVRPDRQRSGVGSALINEGVARLKTLGAKGCVLTGSPDYYNRFGFVADTDVTYLDVPGKFVQWVAFDGSTPIGEVRFSDGLQE